MIVLFIAAILGAVALLYFWSQTVSSTRHEAHDQRRQATESEGRAQYLANENRALWDQLLLLDQLPLPPDRHRLAFELNLLLPYLWQSDVNPFYINELKIKAEPLIKAINDPVINRLWSTGTLESVSKIPVTLLGQLRDPGYDPEHGLVRQHDLWYPSRQLWSD